MKNIKISRTGLCIFLLFVPIIALILVCFCLSYISTLPLLSASSAALAVCMVGMILCVVLICVFMYRSGPALVALILLKRIKKNLDDKSRAELDETSLSDFAALMRQKPPSADTFENDSGVDEDDTGEIEGETDENDGETDKNDGETGGDGEDG